MTAKHIKFTIYIQVKNKRLYCTNSIGVKCVYMRVKLMDWCKVHFETINSFGGIAPLFLTFTYWTSIPVKKESH